MGNNFSVYGEDYRVTVEVQNNSAVLALKVIKTKKMQGDPKYVFYKKYTKSNLPQELKQFQSIKSLHQYLQQNKEKIKIVGTSIVIPLKEKQVQISFQNKSAQSMLFVQGVNEQVKQGEQALKKLEKQIQILSQVNNLINHNNFLKNQDDDDNDIEFIYAKLFSFYQKLCDQNPQRKKTQKLTLIQLVDQIVSQHDFLQAQRNPMRENKGMKKAKPINQKEEQILKLNTQITKLQIMLETSKQTSRMMMELTLKSQYEQIDKIKKQEQIKQKSQMLLRIQGYIHDKRTQIAKANVMQIKIKFQNEGDMKSYIEHRLDQIQELKYELLQEKNNVKLLQKQIQNMRNGSSINFSNISGQNEQGDYKTYNQ